MNKNFDITNTIDVEELAKRWGVTKKTIDNRRYRGQGPSYFKIGGKIKYDLDDVRQQYHLIKYQHLQLKYMAMEHPHLEQELILAVEIHKSMLKLL